MDFCLIFVPFGHYDEPEILPYENTSICPKGADVRHSTTMSAGMMKRRILASPRVAEG
jgi:hypothetical protein